MTFEDFRKVTQRKNSFDKYWHYGIAITFGVFCLFGIFYVGFIDTGKFRSLGYVVYPGLLLIFAMSFSAFYLLPNRYKIVEIASSLNSEDKRKLVDSFFTEHCQTAQVNGANYFACYLKRRWRQSIYKLHFYYDDSRFAFYLQGKDYNGGWIDFGETERKRTMLKKSIERLISQ